MMQRKYREKIGGGPLFDDIITMSEGNPGAAVALAAIMKFEGEMGYMTILNLDDMNIRGAQIWICYKDFCKCEVDQFIKRIKARDPAMIYFVNQHRGHDGYKAVDGGASYLDQRPVLEASEIEPK